MADEVLNALFTAEETISDALSEASRATSSFDRQLSELNVAMANASLNSKGAEREFEEFAESASKVSGAVDVMEPNIHSARNALLKLQAGTGSTEKQMQQLQTAMTNVNRGATMAEQGSDELSQAFSLLRGTGSLTGEQLGDIQTKMTNMAGTAQATSAPINTLNRAMLSMYGAAQATEQQIDDFNNSVGILNGAMVSSIPGMYALGQSIDNVGDQADQSGRKIKSLAGDLSLLNAVAGTSAFQFSSLSVNIGPFNIALRNFLTQVPAILTGMSTMLALVTSLIGAFITLGAVTGALVLGGALAFFEEFSAQFEESAEAVEALMGALRDLFVQALEPVMNEANMDFFIDAVNGAARVVNRFAQFSEQMRDEIMQFYSMLDTDISKGFEAMHDSFVLMMPILATVVEFFINEIPEIMTRFAKLTDTISGDVGLIMRSFGGLVAQLLDFASIVLSVVTPALVTVVDALTIVFAFINALPSGISAALVGLSALSFILSLLTIKFFKMLAAMSSVHTALYQQAGASTVLGATYTTLYNQLGLLIAGETTLGGVLTATTQTLRASVAAWLSNASAKLASLGSTNALIIAMTTQLAIMSQLIAGNIGLAAAARLTAGNMLYLAKSAWAAAVSLGKALVGGVISAATALVSGMLPAIGSAIVGMAGLIAAAVSAAATFLATGSASAAASTGVWSFSLALNSALSPIWAVIGALGLLIIAFGAIAAYVFDINVFDWLASKLDMIIGKIQSVLKGLNLIPSMGDVTGMAQISGDDIQTNPNVDLSFEEKTENNMDIDADPEEKQQISRVVKDAMEEANSLDRRRNGFTGN